MQFRRNKFTFDMHSVRARLMLAGALASLIVAAGPQPVSAETLQQALASAYAYNPRLDAERARLRATDEEVARAKSGYRPTITGQADIQYDNTNIRPDSINEGETRPKGYAFFASQPIFRGLRTYNAVNEAESGVRAGRENLRSVEQDVLLEAVTAFVDVVRDQAIVRLRENNVNVLSRELKATQDRFSVGEVTRTDVAQAQARRAAAVSALDLAKANLKSSRATFERVIGHSPSGLIEPSANSNLIPRSLEDAIGAGLRENPFVIAALYREEQARYTIERIRGELLPEVTVDASYSNRFDTSRFTDETENTNVTGRVTVPIYEGGEVYARVRQAKHTHVALLQEVEQVRTEVQSNIVSAWSQWQAARAQLTSDQSQVAANRTALAGVREEERVGQRTLLEVLNAELELLNSEVQLLTTQRNLVVSAYSLLSTVGRLNAVDTGVTGTIYDPEEHYFEVRKKWWGLSITHDDGSVENVDLWESHGSKLPLK